MTAIIHFELVIPVMSFDPSLKNVILKLLKPSPGSHTFSTIAASFILYITKSPVWNRGAGGFVIVAFKMIFKTTM